MRDICAARLSAAPHILQCSSFGSARSFESVSDPLNNHVDLGDNLVVPEPQHLVSRAAQKLSSAFVAIQLIGVLRTIELDYELCFKTKEVCEKWPEWTLSAELESLELAATQARP